MTQRSAHDAYFALLLNRSLHLFIHFLSCFCLIGSFWGSRTDETRQGKNSEFGKAREEVEIYGYKAGRQCIILMQFRVGTSWTG